MRIWIDEDRLQAVAKLLKDNPPEEQPLNFYSIKERDGEEIVLDDIYPPIGHPRAVDYFFAGTLQEYGFWLDTNSGYNAPFYVTLSADGTGKPSKGSDALWRCLKKTFDRDPDAFTPVRLAQMSFDEFRHLFASDLGPVQFPRMTERYKLAVAYGMWFVEKNVTPEEIIAVSNDCEGGVDTLRWFLHCMRLIPGYGQDPLQKKMQLLAMALVNRPENFLHAAPDNEFWTPMVDYHLMRVLLRMRVVKVDGGTEYRLSLKTWVTQKIEYEIRSKCFEVLTRIRDLSGLTNAKINIVFWMARKYCPEMTKPECVKCSFNNACGKHTDLFQPVGLPRTNYY